MDWNAMAAPWLKWEAGIEAAHRTLLDGLIERAALQTGEAVLDIGCGSGASLLRAIDAVGPEGRVLAVDIAPPLAARAVARVPRPLSRAVRVEVGDAQTFEFEPGAYDTAISLFGTMFFADTVAAFANIRKALRPGGRMTLVAWAAPARNDWFAVSRRIATERLGPGVPPDPLAPGPFAFADASRVLDLLQQAGWQASVETVDLDMLPAGSPAEVAEQQADMGAAALVLRERGGSAEDRAAIVASLTEAFAGMVRDGQIRVAAQLHYFKAISPA